MSVRPNSLEKAKKSAELRKSFIVEQLQALDFFSENCTLEIGCGHGDFLIDYASNFTDRFCLGIDLVSKRLEKCKKKKNRFNLQNLSFLKAEAYEFLEALLAEIKFDQVFVIYPDPWPKKRHWRRRLIQQNFLNILAQRTLPNSKLFFKTDSKEYIDWTKNEILKNERWELEEGSIWPLETKTFFSQITGENEYKVIAVRI